MKGEEWKAVYVTHDGKLVHNLGTRIQLIGKALERGYDKTSGKSGGEYLQTEYLKNEDEYLVSGAQLRCSMATSKKMTIEGRTYVPENPSETTYLECEENRMESGEGKVNATTKDCVVYKNIKPFRCNCRVGPCDDEEKDMLLIDESCLTEGTCKALIDLSEHWDNYPSQVPHFRYRDERFGEVSGITMMSMLFCKHGGIITPVTSGQELSFSLDLAMEKMTEYLQGKVSEEEIGEVISWTAKNCGLMVNDIVKGQFSKEKNEEAYQRSQLYDEQIIAWTYYWNQKISGNIFCEIPFTYQFEIDPNVVKAMIAQESSFGLITKENAGKNPSRNVMQSLATGNSVVWVAAGINPYENGMFKEGDSISFKRLDGTIGNDGALATDNLPNFTQSDLLNYRDKQHFEDFDILKNMFYKGEDEKYIVDFNKVTSNMSIATGVGELATKIEEQRNVYDGVAAYNSLPGYVEAINRHLADMGMEGLE